MTPDSRRAVSQAKSSDDIHSGVVTLGLRSYAWAEGLNGEIELTKLDKLQAKAATLGELGLSKADEHTLVNAMLSQFRRNAIPNGSQYYAASAVISDDGHLFLASNNELNIKDQFAGRGCAETTALRKAQEGLQRPDVKLRAVYLMSGQAKKMPDGTLEDRQKGHVACLCGECRDNLREHMLGDGSFIMLPTGENDRPLKLNAAASSVGELAPGEGWLISHARMYPLPQQQVNEQAGIAEVVRDGYMAITGDKAMPLLQPKLPNFSADLTTGNVQVHKSALQQLLRAYQQVDMGLPALEVQGDLTNINRAMLQLVKKAYKEHEAHIPPGKNLKITVVMLKTDEGKFYPGVAVEGEGWLPSKPPLFANALANANNHIGYSDVYMMTFDTAQIQGEMQAANAGVPQHRMDMPNAAALGRLIKNLHSGDDPKITVLPVNDGQLDAQQLERYAQRIGTREMFGPAFSHPKSQFQRTTH